MPNILPVHNKIAEAALAARGDALGRKACYLILSGCAYTCEYVSLGLPDHEIPDLGGKAPSLPGLRPVLGINLATSFETNRDVQKPSSVRANKGFLWVASIDGISGRMQVLGGYSPIDERYGYSVLIGTTPEAVVKATKAAIEHGWHDAGDLGDPAIAEAEIRTLTTV